MELKQIGEFGLIDLIKADTVVDFSNVIVGIGDDAAVFLPSPRHLQLFTTDMLVEGVHFDLATTTPWQLGYKAMAVNISDIAAMGGVARHATVSIALPRHMPVEFVINLYEGMKEICRRYKINIVGGDTVSSPDGLIINVAMIGEVEPAGLVKRSGAKAGDLVAVTGTLGNSAAGLELLLRGNWEVFDFAWPLVTAHLTPSPQVEAGIMLASYGASSLNDISDGLASEANEIARASNVGMRIFARQIPLSRELRQAADVLNKPALNYALYGGEDYQLLFTISPVSFQKLVNSEAGNGFTVIGEVVDNNPGVAIIGENGQAELLQPKGYNHFS